MLSVGFLFLYTRFIWLWSYLALCRAFLSHRCFLCYEKLHLSVSFELCVRVRANERDREQALSQAVNAHTHRTHSLLLLFFLLFFSLLASLFLVRWRGFVRYVLCDKRPPNPASERERSESKAKHIYSLAVLESLLTPAKLSCQSARTVTTCRQTITN